MASYMELRAAFGNGDLANRIEVALIIAAQAITVEDAGTANHANRLIWARKAFVQTASLRDQMLMAVLATNKDLTIAQIQGATDAELQTAVDAAVNTFADGS